MPEIPELLAVVPSISSASSIYLRTPALRGPPASALIS
jgi:hypothetical protein